MSYPIGPVCGPDINLAVFQDINRLGGINIPAEARDPCD
ncbi:unnamed protein product, partial [marine sediment metagenome]